MKLETLAEKEIDRRLEQEGLRLRTGPFVFSVRSVLPDVQAGIKALYAAIPVVEPDSFIDFHLAIQPGRGLRRWFRQQARFIVDGVEPFRPLPRAQALPMLEWGMNWCITAYGHHQLVIHAAAVAYADQALILPAPPGSGKSTLCAALTQRGARLLSDELTLLDLSSGQVHGLARPVNLKNDSIRIIRNFAPEAVFSPLVHDTAKGTVALMKPPDASIDAAGQPATPRCIVFPRYVPGASPRLVPKPSGAGLIALADNGMNYHILGRHGFEAVGRLTAQCRCYDFEYSDLDQAVDILSRLVTE